MIDSFLQACLSNIVIAVMLGLCGGVALRLRQPVWAHAFWLLALVKLVTPPLADIAIWTDQVILSASAISELPIISDAVAESVGAAVPEGTALGYAWSLEHLAFGLWILGGIVSILIAARHISRFHTWTKSLRDASVAVQDEVDEFARRVGVRSIPRTLVTTDPVSPMLCPTPSGALLVLPTQLLSQLDTAGRHAMIVHELAHLRRRDWLVRFLEIAVVAVWWWLPLVYWLRQGLRESEEICCDAWVTSELPGSEQSYAEALVATADLLAASTRRTPVHVMSMSPVRELEERVRMMMTKQVKRSLGVWGRLAVFALAVICLPFSGTVAQELVHQDPVHEVSADIKALRETSLDIARDSIDVYELTRIASSMTGVTFILGSDVKALPEADRTIKHLKVEKMNLVDLLDLLCRHTQLAWECKQRGLVTIRAQHDFVTCLGAFSKPGRFRLNKAITIMELLAEVPLSPRADLSRVTVIRPDPKNPLELVIDVEAMIKTGRTAPNVMIRPNNIVYVPSTWTASVSTGLRKQAAKFERPQSARALVNKDIVEKGDLVACLIGSDILKRPGMEQLKMLTQPQRIGESGTILVPYMGSLKVIGMTRKQVEAAVVKGLQAYFTVPVTMTARISSDQWSARK